MPNLERCSSPVTSREHHSKHYCIIFQQFVRFRFPFTIVHFRTHYCLIIVSKLKKLSFVSRIKNTKDRIPCWCNTVENVQSIISNFFYINSVFFVVLICISFFFFFFFVQVYRRLLLFIRR